jgi:diguanylate cyclase (GGDEF)-like protein
MRTRPSLLMKFAVASAIPMVVLAGALSELIHDRVTDRNLDSAVQAAQLVAGLGIQPQLSESDLSEGLSTGELQDMDTRIRAGLLDKKVVRIKVWNRAGTIVYSEDPTLVGKTFDVEHDLHEALEGEIEAEISELDSAEDASESEHGRLLEVYVPIRFAGGGEPAGAFEIYLPYAPLERDILHDSRSLQAWMLGGLALLYLVLFRIVVGASRRLRDQAAELEQRADENEFLALHDSLTELPNRRLFHDRVRQAVAAARRDDSLVAVMIMDLDRFKEINDTLGHHVGDDLLRQTAQRLRDVIREQDSIARLGGDEFAILVSRFYDEGALFDVVERVQDALDDPFGISDTSLDVTASIGIALYPDHGAGVDELMQRADVAMYAAKHDHSGHQVYSFEHDPYSPERLRLVGELRRAIDSDQIALCYQPKIDLRSGRVMGVEALVRWDHSELGVLTPDAFVSLAENTGLIKPLSRRVLQLALEQWRRWAKAGFDIDLAVNISVRNLLDASLAEDLRVLLDRYAVPASRLTLEITESSIMADPIRTTEILKTLSDMGILISVDDFGTGYSSLAYLKQLPVGEIKIDRSFISDVDEDDNAAVIVRSTIDLGRNLGLRVVAEGVETEATLELLSDLGCDVAQGYYILRPKRSAEITEWLTARSEHETLAS